MPVSRNLSSYPDVVAFFNRVLESPRGCRIRFDTVGKAKNFRLRCYAARKADMNQNNTLFKDSPDFRPNHSIWNSIMLSLVQQEDGSCFVVGISGEAEMHTIEDI